jgi:hypothetical protein
MPEIIDPVITSIISLRLSNFVVMMREFKIASSRMNINRACFEYFSSHSRAFNVPSRSTLSPRRFPEWLVYLRFFP